MAPIKFEEQLKEKLEKRTIQPSPEAWKKLSDRLDDQGKNKTYRGYWWLGIAASITGIILVTMLVFNNSKRTIEPIIVDSPAIENNKTEKIISNEVEALPAESINNTKPIAESSEEVKHKVKSQIQSPNFKPVQTALKVAVATQIVKEDKIAPKATETPLTTTNFEDSKFNDVVAEIKRLQTENTVVSETELDSMLKQAERDILKHRIKNENSNTVDANALLQDVEADLEQSFRAKVFEALLNNYETVKTAVAKRNN